MNTLQKPLAVAAIFVAGALCATVASATPFIVTLVEQGSNVVATGSGDFDTTGLSSEGPGTGGTNLDLVDALNGQLGIGAANVSLDWWDGASGPTTFGSGAGSYVPATTASGDAVYLYGFGQALFLPTGYVSGTNLSSTATWNNTTFASLGVTTGTYTWTWGNGADQSFTLEIGPAAISTPEPSALAMFGGGLLLLGCFVGLRRRRTLEA